MNKVDVKAVKNAWKIHFKAKLTQEDVDSVLNRIKEIEDFVDDKDLSAYFGVSNTTIKEWRAGQNEPNGANKMAFNFILCKEGLKRF